MGDFIIIVHKSMYEDQILEKLDKIGEKLEEHDQRFLNIEKILANHDRRFDAIDKRLSDHDQQFDSMNKRFDAIDKRLDSHGQQFFEIREELDFTHHHVMLREEFSGIISQLVTKQELKEELKKFVTKEDLKEMWLDLQGTLDAHTVILKRLDEERVFTNKRITRIENDLNRVKVHVNLT